MHAVIPFFFTQELLVKSILANTIKDSLIQHVTYSMPLASKEKGQDVVYTPITVQQHFCIYLHCLQPDVCFVFGILITACLHCCVLCTANDHNAALNQHHVVTRSPLLPQQFGLLVQLCGQAQITLSLAKRGTLQ